jgi:hypothetical protein
MAAASVPVAAAALFRTTVAHSKEMSMILRLFLLFGLVFGTLVALITFLITYQEYRKLKFEGWRLWKVALKAAGFTLAFFCIEHPFRNFPAANRLIKKSRHPRRQSAFKSALNSVYKASKIIRCRHDAMKLSNSKPH